MDELRSMRVSLRRHRVLYVLVLLTLAAAALRLPGLNGGLWYDEMMTLIRAVRSPLGTIVTSFPDNNDHKLYSVLAHLSIRAFGEHPWSLRLPAFVFGVAAVPMLYLFGTAVTTRLEAFLSAALLTVLSHHVIFSQNARAYGILLVCVLLATWLLLRGLRSREPWVFVAYGAVAGLGAYAHLTMVPIVIAHALAWLGTVLAERRQGVTRSSIRLPLLGFLVAAFVTAVLYAPMLLDVQHFFATQRLTAQRVETPLWAALEALKGLRDSVGASWAVAVGFALFAVGMWRYYRENPLLVWLFLLPGPIVAGTAVVAQRPLHPRFFLFMVGFGILAAVRGTMWVSATMQAKLARRKDATVGARLGTVVVALMVMALASQLRDVYRYPKQDFEGALHFVEKESLPTDRVLLVGLTELPYNQFYGKQWTVVHTVGELNRARAEVPAPWLLYTFPMYLRKAVPELFAIIERECGSVRVFHGTIRGGDVVVCRFLPHGSSNRGAEVPPDSPP